MSRPNFRVIARFLRKIREKPELNAYQVISYAGLNYYVAQKIIEMGYAEKVRLGKRKTRLRLTEKGRRFLRQYEQLEKL